MRMRKDGDRRRVTGLALSIAALAGLAGPAQAYLYWSKPAFVGAPAVGGEPGITLPML